MFTSQIAATLAFSTSAALAAGSFAYSHNPNWNLTSFTSLVSFGDSYTDDSRLSYFIAHNGSAPPVGYANPAVRETHRLTNDLYSCFVEL